MMIMTSVGISLITLAVVYLSCNADNPKPLNIKYHVSTDFQTWFQALINCRSAGMELVTISTEKEENDLETFLKHHKYNDGYWLSGTNIGNGIFYWASTGSPVHYTNWLLDQPDNKKVADNNYMGENCIQYGVYNDSRRHHGWNDLSCGIKLLYICEEPYTCNRIKKRSLTNSNIDVNTK
ncbi:C-type lectin 37Db-like isoform X2 [Euwallacea similis]|uniref:C-type lectin 37Db-like isoform X2 n=1 Tax=Euwallacea similis TaxID=1736056 RepID=UPI00344B6C2A